MALGDLLFFRIFVVILPWPLKRLVLLRIYKYSIARSAHIGFSWVFPVSLDMRSGSQIGHFNVVTNIKLLSMGEFSRIGRFNWITGFPLTNPLPHFLTELNRDPSLFLGKHAAITKQHHIDATNTVSIGPFSIIAGYGSQVLTHSINIANNIQESEPVTIGDYCFLGTRSTILPGSSLPSYSVLGAHSLLNTKYIESYTLYAGVPATAKKRISEAAEFFNRLTGYVL